MSASLVLVEDFMLGRCDITEVHAERPKNIKGPAMARWKAFYIGRHSADLCDKCATEWKKTQAAHGGTTEVRKRPTRIVSKTRTEAHR